MLILTGKNLKERQKQLNEKVNNAAKDKIDFSTVKHEPEKSDVDKLFKIDLAVKCKNTDYVLEVLKSGDPLHISRVLNKCKWLYEKDFMEIINSAYLSKNIFPLMSIKMRNKLLTTVSTHLKHGDERAIDFFTFCMEVKLHNIGLKFLILAPDSFKLDVMLMKSKTIKLVKDKDGEYLKFFIGDSFTLAENYIKILNTNNEKSEAVYLLRHMYSISNEKYLDIVETCNENNKIFGRRLSRHIIQNHKAKVMKKPSLYVNILNKNIVSRNITVDEAKLLAIALLPKEPSQFFSKPYSSKQNFCVENFVLDLIPAEERFSFVKKIFTEKYPGQAFESCSEFYSNDCYKIMTPEERESWALTNIKSQNEILGSGNDYLWYQFINFEKAFTELTSLIMKSNENTKRSELLRVLIDSAKNEKDLIKLLNYYSNRHRNEVIFVAEEFLEKLISDHKVWRFSEECWAELEKIFYNSKVYDKLRYASYTSDCRVLAFMYYVANKKPVPDILKEFLDTNDILFYIMKRYIKKLEPETETIIEYILQFYANKIEVLSKMPYENVTKYKIKQCIRSCLDLLKLYEKTKNDLPEIMLNYIKLDFSEYENHDLLEDKNAFSSNDIMRYLKEDAKLVVNEFPKIKKYLESSYGNLNWLIRKLRVYFSHDISKEYLTLFNDCLSTDPLLNHMTADVIVRGIITLSDLTSNIEFLEKYRPQDKKVDLAKLPTSTFNIQRAICKQMHCSRPPLPLLNIFQYVTGDYVQYCLALFRWYLLNLPYPLCVQFVETLIDKPVSIQKHGLRLAFECFDEEKLKTIVLDCWTKTKNVPLRMILYKSLYKKILSEDTSTQLQLFEAFITLTLDLNEHENEAFQSVSITDFPSHLVRQYLEAAWKTVSKFPDRSQNFAIMVKIIKDVERSICLLSDTFIDDIVDNHVYYMLDEKQILNAKLKQGFDNLLESKWHLTISNLVYVVNEKKLIKNSLTIDHIIKECIAMWDKRNENNVYVVRKFVKKFIEDLDSKSYDHEDNNFSNVIVILKSLKQHIKELLPGKDIYYLVWKLQSSIITKQVILESKLHMETNFNGEQVSTEMKRSGILLGKEFGSLIITAEKGKFYRMFYEQFESIVTNTIQNIIVYYCKKGCNDSVPLSSTDMLILFCLGLLEHQIPETYMFALYLLPVNCKDDDIIHFEDYIVALKKIQNFQNEEIQCYVYEKFVNNDFEYRQYLL